MDFWATKDDYERETEEAERLMRPAPKVKPPRHDKRREDIRPERDPDVAGDPDISGDPDMSLNYKNVGGSVAHRVRARFLQADLVRVWNKEDDVAVNVSEETLKGPDAGKYEVIEDGEPSAEGKPEKKPESDEAGKKPESDEVSEERAKELAGAGRKLLDQADLDFELASILKSLADPQAELGVFAVSAPMTPAKPFLKGRKVPAGIETIRDLQQAVLRAKKEAPARPPAEKTDKARAEKTDKTDAQSAPDPVVEKLDKLISIMERFLAQAPAAARPEIKKEIEEAKQTVEEKKAEPEPEKESPAASETPSETTTETPAAESEAAGVKTVPPETPPVPTEKPKKKEKSEKPEKDEKKEKPEKAPQRVVSREELRRAIRVAQSLPGPLGGSLLEAGLHPDDIFAIASKYEQRKKEPLKPEDIDATIEIARRNGALVTRLSEVQPPKSARNSQGQLNVPWDKLSAEDQAKALVEHRNDVLATSLALRERVTKALLDKTGIPRSLAEALTTAKLTPKGSWKQQESQARRAAQKVYESVFTSGKKPEPLSDEAVRTLLRHTVNDPVSQRLTVAYLQAQDALEARDKFLSTSSPHQIDERDPPNKIMANLSQAMEFLRQKQKRYPEEYRGANDPVASFRTRVVERLQVLSPTKANQLEPQLWEIEADDWDEKQRTHEELKAKRAKAQKKYRKAIEAAKKAYEEELAASSPYRSQPVPTVEDRLRDQGIVIPSEPDPLPPKPIGYDDVRMSPAASRAQSRGFWDKLLRGKTASADLVVARFLGFSICAPVEAMGKSLLSPKNALDRTSVYWGVEPYPAKKGPEEYPGWQQAHACDLKDADFNTILTAARAWLKEAVLSEAIEGILPDTQLRAALDLAVRDVQDGKYSVGLHPTLYNRLLARLAGEPETETLLTVREASSGSLYAEITGEERPMRASAEIRKFASSIADENPGIAFDLANLAFKLAEEEKKEQEPAKEQQVQASGHQAGEMPPALKEHMEKQQAEKEGEDKEGEDKAQEGQKTAAYRSLKAAVIKAAQANPAARPAFLPVLQAIKQIG